MNLPPVIFVMLQTGAAANGGIESISRVMTELRGHRPIVVTNRVTDRLSDWRRHGIETHVIPETASKGLKRDPLGSLASYWRYHRALKSLIARTGARVVHANDPLAFQLALSAVKRSPGVRIAMNLRDTLDPGRPPPRLRYRLSFAAADHVFFLSEDMADRWAKVAPNARRSCSVTYSIVDRQRFRKASGDPQTDPPIVLLSGIIRPKKGQLEFIRHVAPTLVAEGVEVWLAGDFYPEQDSYMASCAVAAAPLGNGVKFLGVRNDLPDLIGKSTVVAVASRHEGLVRAMIEAMSCGRPVVSFDVCSAREMLQEKSSGAGMVVEHGDYSGMAEAILEYSRNPAAAADAGRAGADAADLLFDAERVVDRYEQVYRSLAGERSRKYLSSSRG